MWHPRGPSVVLSSCLALAGWGQGQAQRVALLHMASPVLQLLLWHQSHEQKVESPGSEGLGRGTASSPPDRNGQSCPRLSQSRSSPAQNAEGSQGEAAHQDPSQEPTGTNVTPGK